MQTGPAGQRLKLQHLKVAMAVAERGSMQQAARHLAISQPVVSKIVADLEDMLGVRLFDRSPQGVEPTRYGRALLKRANAVFDDLRMSMDEIRFLADPTTGEVHIGSTEPLLAGFGLAVMERLWRQYPLINIRVVEGNSSALLTRELPERHIDLALVPLAGAAVPDDQEAAILFQDRLRVVVGAKSPWARRRGVTLADLANEPWCVARSAIGALVTDAFGASGLPAPRIALTATSTHLLFQLLESGRYVGHFGDGLLDFYTSRFALKKLPIALPARPFSVAVVTLKNRTISPVAQLFIDCARDVAGAMGRRPARHPARSPD